MSKHQELEDRVGSDHVLVVNSTMEAKDIVPWQKAVTLLFEEKVTMVLPRADGAKLRSAHLAIDKPLVVCLVKYAKRRYRIFNSEDAVTKAYVRQRDNFTCAYCGRFGNTIDHVIPASRGGKNTWGNLVTACSTCNGLKADRTPAEAGLPEPVIKAGYVGNARLSECESLMMGALSENL